MAEQRVPPYPDALQTRERLVLDVYEYRAPFNYANVAVHRRYEGSEEHGVELFNLNTKVGEATSGLPPEYIEISEELPIVRVAVIGSACTPPGYIQLEAEPCEGFRRKEEFAGWLPTRFRVDGLWGMHLRFDQWSAGAGEPFEVHNISGAAYPERLPGRFGEHRLKLVARELPLAGMSCAVFEIPRSTKVRVTGGGAVPGWTTDNYPDDNHYSFRIIRTTVIARTDGGR